MAKEAHSAIPSWSGYVYQGKVALYHVLRIIENKLEEDNSYNFSKYSLEIEWQEDFAIKNDKFYESVHQVKAYQDGTKNTEYKSALLGLIHKIQNLYTVGYLHILTPIVYNRNITDFRTYQEKNFYIKFYPKKYAKNVHIYIYCNGNETCGLDEIDRLIIEKIEKIYRLKEFSIDARTDTQYKYVQFKLYQLLDTHILEIHKGDRSKYDTILFEYILSKFNNNYEEYSKEYEHIKVKNTLLYQINRYCDDSELCSNTEWVSEEDCQGCVLFDVEQILERMSAEEVYKVVYNATPDYRVFEDLIRENGLKYGLIRILHNINPTCRTQNFHFRTSNYYVPSSITDPRNKNEIAKKILENKSLDLLVNQFEIDVYISDNVEITDLENQAKKIRSVDDDTLNGIYESRDENTISKIKKLQIKPADEVEEEINNAH